MLISNVADLIEAFGGPKNLAALTGVGVTAVSNWKVRGRVARSHVMILSDEAQKRGLSVSPDIFGLAGNRCDVGIRLPRAGDGLNK